MKNCSWCCCSGSGSTSKECCVSVGQPAVREASCTSGSTPSPPTTTRRGGETTSSPGRAHCTLYRLFDFYVAGEGSMRKIATLFCSYLENMKRNDPSKRTLFQNSFSPPNWRCRIQRAWQETLTWDQTESRQGTAKNILILNFLVRFQRK